MCIKKEKKNHYMCHLTQNMWKMQLMIKLDEQIPKNIIIKKKKKTPQMQKFCKNRGSEGLRRIDNESQ